MKKSNLITVVVLSITIIAILLFVHFKESKNNINDYAEALHGVIDFYVENCKSNIDLIPIEYNKLYTQKKESKK